MYSVLYVDDDPDVVEIYTEVLEQLCCSVVSAPEGQVALRLATRLRLDLIITDVSMPGMNGLELCQRLRADETLRHIPRIIHSGESAILIPRDEVFLPKGRELPEFMDLVIQTLGNPCHDMLDSVA